MLLRSLPAEIHAKMSKIRMDEEGNMLEYGRAWKYATKHFPSVLNEFKKRRSK